MDSLKEQYCKLKHFYYSYIFFFFKYFAPKKLFNLLFNIYEFKKRKIVVKSVPAVVHIDVASGCVLHCPLCPTGKGDKGQRKAIMKFVEFKQIFDKVKDYAFFVWLYNWGEPFLCKDIFKIVDYCHKNNVGVKIDSNLNYYNDEILENIVKYKIDYISFSIDGLSQKVYQFYRKNGKIEKVIGGLKKISEYKEKHKSNRPIMVWQLLLNNENIEEIEDCREAAKKINIDIFEAHPLRLFTEVDSKYTLSDYNKYLSKTGMPKKEARAGKSESSCRYLWCSLVFNPGNSYSPCPIIYKDSDVFGTIKENINKNISEIYNSEMFVESRKLFTNRNYKPGCFTPCKRCDWYTKA